MTVFSAAIATWAVPVAGAALFGAAVLWAARAEREARHGTHARRPPSDMHGADGGLPTSSEGAPDLHGSDDGGADGADAGDTGGDGGGDGGGGD